MGSYLDKLLLGIKQVYRNGSPMPLRPVINFVNFYEVLDNPALGSTDIYTSTGGGSSGGTLLVIEHNASPVTARPILNFIGGTVADNVGNNSTDITLGSILENGGAAITQRPVLNLIGLAYADNPGNSSMDFTAQNLTGPGAVITGDVTLAATDTFKVFADGPYTITVENWVPGVEYTLLARGAGGLNGAGQVTLSAGSATFSIEDPQLSGTGYRINSAGTAPNLVSLRTDYATYRFAIDAFHNILRSIG